MKHLKWKLLVPVAIVAVLAAAFFTGGKASDDQVQLPEEAPTQETAPVPEEEITEAEREEETPSAEDPEEPIEEPIEEPMAEDTDPAPETERQPEMEIDPETGKDAYQTDPVPEGKPAPVEPQNAAVSDEALTCTISISCAAILNNQDLCDPEKLELVPENGWVLEPVTVTFYEGESVFNVLQRTCKQNKLHMEYMDTPIYNSAYIEGIHNLYEFDVGDLSGWMYSVNDWFPNYGCSRYQLQDGDIIEWVYTCDLGEDVGGAYSNGNGRYG